MNHLLVVLSFFISLFLAMLIIPRILVIAAKHSLYDMPDKRKTHTGAIPRIGGVSFFPCILFSMMFVIGVFYMFAAGTDMHNYYPNNSELCLFFCGLLFLYLGGVKDDLVRLRYFNKFLIQIISSSIIVFSGLYLNNLYGFLGIYYLSPFIGIPLTILALVFIINAMNLIDGMDGLASGISIFALCVYGTLFLLHGMWYYSVLAFSTIGVLIPFFYYNMFGNVKKGCKLFMGDSGSLTLGLILGFLAVRYAHYNPDVIKPIGNMLVIAMSPILIPMLDVMRVILSRLKRRKHIFVGDRCHIHHKLMDMGIGKLTALVMILCISSGLCILNFVLIELMNITFIFVIDISLWVLINMYFTHIIKKRGSQHKAAKIKQEIHQQQIEKISVGKSKELATV